ncbi:MAG: hypothetical protein IT223_06905 [Crocinitomicaceae bacterium]|nr:hypothetical protein [Crocinitomicaceae bacterium]
MQRIRRILAVVIVLSLFASCLKRTEYPDEPTLKFKSLRTTADSAIITLEFIDGDGNFGLGQGDTAGIFDDCLKRYNMYCEYFEQQNGVWVHRKIDPCLNPNAVPFYYRIPYVEPTGQVKSQEGEIKVVMTPFYSLSGAFDTCRFEIHIADRSFNTSNTIVTSSYLKP